MINERTLLERLADPDPPGERRLSLNQSRLKRSIVAHLQRILNSRQGHAPAQPDFGIPDLNEFIFSYPDSITPMRQAIQASIEKHEPRLKNIKVAWVRDEDDPLNMRFEITAKMIAEHEDVPVSFATSLTNASELGVDEM